MDKSSGYRRGIFTVWEDEEWNNVKSTEDLLLACF